MPNSGGSIGSGSILEPAALLRLRTIAAIRPEFAGLQSIEEIAQRGASLAVEHVGSQSASVFLLDKLGKLTRVALVGKGKDGRNLDNLSLPPESHAQGESFTGKAVMVSDGSPFGAAQWSNLLADLDDISPESRLNYETLLGELHAAISVPLNGTYKTFGVLEVINKADDSDQFDIEDVNWLSLIAHELALSLSHRGLRQRLEILNDLSVAVLSMFDAAIEEREFYGNVARVLTSQALPFCVCVVRVRNGDQLATVAASTSGIPISGRDDAPVLISHGFAGKILAADGPELFYIPDIADDAASGLRNWDWAKSSALISYWCLPLLVAEREISGTLSLYSSFRYELDADEKTFLLTLARSLATFANGRLRLQEFQEDAHDAVMARYDGQLAPAHDFLDVLGNLEAALVSLEGKSLGTVSGQKDYERVVSMVTQARVRIKNDFAVSEPEVIDLNELIRGIVAQKRKSAADSSIDFHIRFDRRVPLIKTRTAAFRYVIKDLIINAVKTIRRKGDGYGLIVIETRVIKQKNKPERIEITVSDTGEGMPREQWGRIFEAGFTTYPQGTGVGLHLAQGILASYGGSIEVASSTVGEGSTFRVSIPMWNSA